MYIALLVTTRNKMAFVTVVPVTSENVESQTKTRDPKMK